MALTPGTRLGVYEVIEQIGEADASIFDAHILLLEDTSLIESVKEQLQSRLVNVDFAYEQVVRSYTRKMRELDDDYFRERAGDFLDVSRRVLRNLQGKVETELHSLDAPSIVLAHDLSPSDTAGFDRQLVLGIATEAGSRTSHSAIMARSLNLPAVVGLRDISSLTTAPQDRRSIVTEVMAFDKQRVKLAILRELQRTCLGAAS